MNPGLSTNIDIVFWAVDYVDIPSQLDGVEFFEPTSEEITELERKHGEPFLDATIYGLASRGRRFFVVGFLCQVMENELDLFDSILDDDPEIPRPHEEFGTILARSPKPTVRQPVG